MVAGVELTYNTNASAMQMANTIFGSGVTVVNASYSGSSYSSAIYSNGDAVAGNVTPADTGIILSTGSATRFTNNSSQSNLSTQTSVNSGDQNNVAGFNAIAGTSTYDASYIDADFIPTEDTMTMQFVFSSDEYPEYTNSIYNDMVGVWINGTHVSLTITHINGAAVVVGQTIVLPTGQSVKLNAGGTFDVTTDSDFEVSSFTYQIESTDGSGNVQETDVSFVMVETIPCFVAGKDLVNNRSIRPVEGGEIEYVHLLFDAHQVIYSAGLATESFLPGPQTPKSFEAEIVTEICAIFPDLDPTTGEGYGPAARPLLKRYEPETLRRRVA